MDWTCSYQMYGIVWTKWELACSCMSILRINNYLNKCEWAITDAGFDILVREFVSLLGVSRDAVVLGCAADSFFRGTNGEAFVEELGFGSSAGVVAEMDVGIACSALGLDCKKAVIS